MSTATATITDQAGVNSAGSFDSAASSLLDLGGGQESGNAVATAPKEGADGAAVREQTSSAGVDAGGAARTPDDGKDSAEVKNEPGPKAAEVKVDEWAVDQALIDKALADPTHGAIVKLLSEQRAKLLGYREHWTIDEARELRSLAPGGMEEIKASVQAGRNARAENLEFASGDVGRQTAALKTIAAEMPEAFAAGVTPYLGILKETNAEAYQKVVGQIATQALQEEGLPGLVGSHFAAIDALVKAAEKGDEAAFKEAFTQVTEAQEFREWAKSVHIGTTAAAEKPQAKVSPEVASLQKELQGYRDKETAAKANESTQIQEEFNTFNKTVDEAWQKSAKEDIEKLLEVIPKNMPAKAREQLVSRLENEIVQELQKRVNDELAKGYGDLGKRVAAVMTNRAWKTNGEKVRDQVSNLIGARAKLLLPHAAKSILDPFSEGTVAAAQSRSAQEEKQGSRQDIRGGASGPKTATPLAVTDMRGNGRGKTLTDEEILDL